MPSRLASVPRRVPQQRRGERRVQALLDAAASVIAASGYDAATMSAIADRAHACIGSLYQFFPNKESITGALRERYCSELRTLWCSLEGAGGVPADELVRKLTNEMVSFLDDRPALLTLFSMPFKTRDTSIRDLLRDRLAGILRDNAPHLSKSRAFVLATVILQIMKAMNELYAEAPISGRRVLVREYSCVLNGYLNAQIWGIETPRKPTKRLGKNITDDKLL